MEKETFDNKRYGFSVTPLALNDDDITAKEKLSLRKVRINIIDNSTGESIEEVDVLTSADSVLFDNGNNLVEELNRLLSYTNTNKTPTNISGIEEGSTFLSVPIKDIITNLLYPYVSPVMKVSCSATKRYYEYGVDISPITFTANIAKKSENIIGVELWKDNVKYGDFKGFTTDGGTCIYNYTDKLASSSKFTVKVIDSKNTIQSNSFSLIFNHPIYYGTIDENTTITETFINGLNKFIDYENDNNITFDSEFTTVNNCIFLAYKSYIRDEENVKIIDQNGLNITNSFLKEKINIIDKSGTNISYTCLRANRNNLIDAKITMKITI